MVKITLPGHRSRDSMKQRMRETDQYALSSRLWLVYFIFCRKKSKRIDWLSHSSATKTYNNPNLIPEGVKNKCHRPQDRKIVDCQDIFCSILSAHGLATGHRYA